MKFLKIVSKGWAGYTGQLGMITFKDGVSTERVSQKISDRISGLVTVEECDENGVSTGEMQGIQARLATESKQRVEFTKALVRQTETERKTERRLDAARGLNPQVEQFYTAKDLEAIADKDGIKGLRLIGDAWDVKSKSIPKLIGLILNAQAEFEKTRKQAMREQPKDNRRHTTTAVEEAPAAKPAEPRVELAGMEDMAALYRAADETEITGYELLNQAHASSGMTLSGWNALAEDKRLGFIMEEMDRVSARLGELTVVETEADEQPAEDEAPSETETPDAEKVDGVELKKDA